VFQIGTGQLIVASLPPVLETVALMGIFLVCSAIIGRVLKP